MENNFQNYLANIDNLRVPEIRRLAKRVAKEICVDSRLLGSANNLLNSKNKNHLRLGINLLLQIKTEPNDLLRQSVRNLADHEDWELREEAAQVIRTLLERDFDYWFDLLKEFIKSRSVNLKRTAVVGSMATGIKPESQIRRIVEEIYEPALNSKEKYIRVNLGPFAFGAFLVRLFPRVAFEYFDQWIKKDDLAKWNVLMAFSASRGKEYPDIARKYIKAVENDKSPVIQKAIKIVSRKLI